MKRSSIAFIFLVFLAFGVLLFGFAIGKDTKFIIQNYGFDYYLVAAVTYFVLIGVIFAGLILTSREKKNGKSE